MHGIRPNRSRVAMLAEGARYRAKNLDLVGVYINPLRRAVAFSVSEGAVVGGGRPPVSGGVRTGSSGSSGRPWLKDLVTTLDLLDRGEPVPTSRRHVDQEFLAFLRTVQGRTAMDQRVMLLAEGIEPALSPPIARWLSRHPKVSAQVRTRSGAWNQNVLEWLQATASPRTGDGAPRNLPKLITAVERWKQGNEGGRRPFAWTPE